MILAIPPYAQRRLPETLPDAPRRAPLLDRLIDFEHESIATIYLAWPAATAPALPTTIMLTENPARGA